MRTALVFLLLAVATGALVFDVQRQLFEPLPLAQDVIVEVPHGAGLRALLERWYTEGIFASERQAGYLSLYARFNGEDTAIKQGEYQLAPGMRAVDITALLVSGRGVLHELAFIEGQRFSELLDTVLSDPNLDHAQPALTADRVMQALGSAGVHPEGRFFPDTYRFARHTADLAILRQAFQLMQRVLDEEWAGRDAGTVLQNADQALILASIVERETGLPAERPEIAGVFTRRLRQGMKLQTDPAVIYGLGAAFDGNLRRRDLERDTPYNTYTRRGLPPTPICSPGRDAIHAALHPAAGETLYFVARGDGSHQFSATVEAHNAAVRKYQLRRRSS